MINDAEIDFLFARVHKTLGIFALFFFYIAFTYY